MQIDECQQQTQLFLLFFSLGIRHGVLPLRAVLFAARSTSSLDHYFADARLACLLLCETQCQTKK
jgi:hypothetical protein